MNRTLIATGPSLNLLGSLISAPTLSPAEDSVYVGSNLYDGQVLPFKFGSASATSRITADLNQVTDPGFENGLADWQSSAAGAGASVTVDTVNQRTGAKCIKHVTGPSLGGSTYLWKDITVRTGQSYKVGIWLKGTGPLFGILVSFPYLNLWWDSSAYVNYEDYALRITPTGTYTFYSVTITTPTWLDANGRDTILMRISYSNISSQNVTVYVDDATVIPGWNLCVLHDIQVDPGSTVTLKSSADNFSTTNISQAFSVVRPWPCYTSVPLKVVSYDQYVRLEIVGVGYSAASIGEMIVCEALSVLKSPAWPLELTYFSGKIAGDMLSERVIFSPNAAPSVSVKLTFKNSTDTAYQEFRDEILYRSEGAQVVLVPDDSADVVIWGTGQEFADFSRDWESNNGYELNVQGFGSSHRLA